MVWVGRGSKAPPVPWAGIFHCPRLLQGSDNFPQFLWESVPGGRTRGIPDGSGITHRLPGFRGHHGPSQLSPPAGPRRLQMRSGLGSAPSHPEFPPRQHSMGLGGLRSSCSQLPRWGVAGGNPAGLEFPAGAQGHVRALGAIPPAAQLSLPRLPGLPIPPGITHGGSGDPTPPSPGLPSIPTLWDGSAFSFSRPSRKFLRTTI